MSQRHRWAAVTALLLLGVLLSPTSVPLYDGVGFPDEPYRYVPARGSGTPAATAAEVTLRVVGGLNTGGLLANSAELGPQVSVYAPPKAFAVPGAGAGEIRLRAEPVVAAAPAPPGTLESNVYALTLTSPAGPVTVRPDAQQLGITLRAVGAQAPPPVMQYRPTAGRPWKGLATRRVGQDNFNAAAPGTGEYVLTRVAAAKGKGGSSSTGLIGVLGAVVLLVAGVLVAVRVASRRQPQA